MKATNSNYLLMNKGIMSQPQNFTSNFLAVKSKATKAACYTENHKGKPFKKNTDGIKIKKTTIFCKINTKLLLKLKKKKKKKKKF